MSFLAESARVIWGEIWFDEDALKRERHWSLEKAFSLSLRWFTMFDS